MKFQLIRLFEYNLWANQKFGEILKVSVFKNPKILTFISHILNAQLIWIDRIKGKVSETKVWTEYPIESAVDKLLESSQAWLEMLENESDFDRMISYQNSLGDSHSSVISDIISHVANHGTHHRGQIALLLREEDIAPPASDFIFFSSL
ncbi:MAG: putative damage-inducible protein DinB [Roseivirga sp.]|jgi:uncharacterized damage-inducible protein DinB